MSLTKLMMIAALGAGMCGCMVGPDYKKPDTKLPATFRWADPNNSRPGAADVSLWWKRFNDPVLDSLINQASSSNLDLRIAASRLAEARAIRGVVAADEWPTVDAGANASRSRQSKNARVIGGIPLQQNNFQLGFDASWELDIFGGTRRAIEAANADVGAASEARNNVLVSVLAEVARNYALLRGYQQRLEVTYNNLRAQRSSLEIAEARFKAGLTSELNVTQARAQLATTQSQIPALEIGEKTTINRLGVLTGKEPGALKSQLEAAGPIPMTEPNVPVGMPSDLLRRRPDIREAERNLAAATARIGAATADLFPRFPLTGSVGLESLHTHNLLEGGSRYWSIGQGISWPVFDAGRIRANIRVQNARQEQAAANYEQAILIALEDVENALIAYGKEQQRRESLRAAVAANQRSLELSQELYRKGLVDFLNVIEAQRALYLVQDELTQSEQAVATNLIALYKALGGGWEEFAIVVK